MPFAVIRKIDFEHERGVFSGLCYRETAVHAATVEASFGFNLSNHLFALAAPKMQVTVIVDPKQPPRQSTHSSTHSVVHVIHRSGVLRQEIKLKAVMPPCVDHVLAAAINPFLVGRRRPA